MLRTRFVIALLLLLLLLLMQHWRVCAACAAATTAAAVVPFDALQSITHWHCVRRHCAGIRQTTPMPLHPLLMRQLMSSGNNNVTRVVATFSRLFSHSPELNSLIPGLLLYSRFIESVL